MSKWSTFGDTFEGVINFLYLHPQKVKLKLWDGMPKGRVYKDDFVIHHICCVVTYTDFQLARLMKALKLSKIGENHTVSQIKLQLVKRTDP